METATAFPGCTSADSTFFLGLKRQESWRLSYQEEGSSNVLQVNGLSLHVEQYGNGKLVLLLHG